MKTYLITLGRMFRQHYTRLLSIIFIVLVSVGFISGVGAATDKIDVSLSEYYKNNRVSDFILKRTDGFFSEEEIALVEERYGKENVVRGMSLETDLVIGGESRLCRLCFLEDFSAPVLNLFSVLKSSEQKGEVYLRAERADNGIKEIELDETVELDFAGILSSLAGDSTDLSLFSALEPVSVKVGEIVQNPLYFARDGEPSYRNPEDMETPDSVNAAGELIHVDEIFYLPVSLIPTYRDLMPLLPDEPLLGTGDLYVALSDRSAFDALGEEYGNLVEREKSELSSMFKDVRVLSLFENYSFLSLRAYSDKVEGIGLILMVAFLLVTGLVVLSTMTRLLDEERAQIGCLHTLGYSAAMIVSKYLLFALIATGIGGVGAYFVGVGVSDLFYTVFEYTFAMPPMSSHVAVGFFLFTFALIVLSALVATAAAGYKMATDTPATLLRPKVPKAGKKVILERIPFLWKLLPFKYKSTVRNVLRFKYRFFMTVISVAFSTALVLVGLALLDVCIFGGLGSAAVRGIAVVVVVFAGLLTAVVVYTLTNINISERNRELATLMVLGYYDGEVAGYIYREVYLDTVIGILFGFPLSVPLMLFLFDVIAYGSLATVSWFVYLIAPAVVLLFTFLVTLLLRRKIVRVRMNESLKAVE